MHGLCTSAVSLSLCDSADNYSSVLRVYLKSIWLTHSFPEIYLMSVVCTFHSFENNLGMMFYFVNYLKGNCRWSFDEQVFYISSKYCFY